MSLYHDVELQLENINLCNDVQEMLGIFKLIGKGYSISADKLNVRRACDEANHSKNIEINISESGTCLRFILTYFAFAGYDSVTIRLGERLSQRPIIPLVDCLNDAGANIRLLQRFSEGQIYIEKYNEKKHYFALNSSESSQFLTSIILYASSLKKQTKITLNADIASLSYIQMTADILKMFGVSMQYEGNVVTVNGAGETCLANTSITYKLDPDYSTACYYWFYSYLLRKPLFIKKIGSISQPDYKFLDVLRQLGINFIEKDDYISVNPDYSPLPNPHLPFPIDMSEMPDQIITLSFLAFCAGIKVCIKGCHTLFLKESDRVAGIIENVRLLGGEAHYSDDVLTIVPAELPKLESVIPLKTYGDHRFAFTFLVLKEKYPCLEIDDIDCVKKSYDRSPPMV